MTSEEIKQKLANLINEDSYHYAYLPLPDKDILSCEFYSVDKEFVEQTRWSVRYRIVTKHNKSGKFFAWSYDAPATELQEYEDEYLLTVEDFIEVEPVEQKVTKYIAIKD